MELIINAALQEIEIVVIDSKQKYSKKYTMTSINNHTQNLYKLYYQMLEQEQLKSSDLKIIYVINGPGSYTGLRIGVVFAKTLAMIYNLDIIPLNLLEAIYYSNNEQNVTIDARGGKLFSFDGQNLEIIRSDSPKSQKYQNDLSINYENIAPYLNHQQKIPYLEVKVEYFKKVL